MRRGALLVLSTLLVALAVSACTGSGPGPVSRAEGQVVTPPRFARIARLLRQGRAFEAAGQPERIATLRGPISEQGLALIRARVPNDLRRQDMPRFLSARQVFGDALGRWVAAIEASDQGAMLRAFGDLDDATQGWIDAYLGRPAETAI